MASPVPVKRIPTTARSALVAFRGTLRKAALEAKDDDAKLKLRGAVLAESDAMRDAEFLVKQGLALVDTPDGETLVQPRVAEAAKPKAPKAEAPAAFDYSHTPPESCIRSASSRAATGPSTRAACR